MYPYFIYGELFRQRSTGERASLVTFINMKTRKSVKTITKTNIVRTYFEMDAFYEFTLLCKLEYIIDGEIYSHRSHILKYYNNAYIHT